MPAKKAMPRQRHVPHRLCVVCRSASAKRDLVRIVRGVDGRIEIDETGKRPGRGAYLCRRRSCWEQAAGGKKDPLGHALRVSLQPLDREALQNFAVALPDAAEEGSDN